MTKKPFFTSKIDCAFLLVYDKNHTHKNFEHKKYSVYCDPKIKIDMSKNKVQFEFPLHCQSEILFEYLATPEGLAEWFADEVTEKGDDFFFSWNGGPAEKATLTRYKTEQLVRFRWEEDEGTKCYFEMNIVIDEITNDLSLNITDFCEEGEEEETQLYWENLVENLTIKLGAA